MFIFNQNYEIGGVAGATRWQGLAVGRVASLTCRGLLSTCPSGSPKAGFPCRRGDGLPSNSTVWTWEGGLTATQICNREQFLNSVWTRFSGLFSSQPFPRYSHLSLMPPYICATSQRHWDLCIFLAQNCIAESSYNLENTKAFQGAGKKTKGRLIITITRSRAWGYINLST